MHELFYQFHACNFILYDLFSLPYAHVEQSLAICGQFDIALRHSHKPEQFSAIDGRQYLFKFKVEITRKARGIFDPTCIVDCFKEPYNLADCRFREYHAYTINEYTLSTHR